MIDSAQFSDLHKSIKKKTLWLKILAKKLMKSEEKKNEEKYWKIIILWIILRLVKW